MADESQNTRVFMEKEEAIQVICAALQGGALSFNRTSFQQQLKLIPKKGKIPPLTKLSLIFNR